MKIVSALILTLIATGWSCAQNITGPSTVNVGETIQYTFSDGATYPSVTWAAGAYGTKVTQWNVGSTYYATILWTAPGTASLTVLDQSFTGRGNLSVTVNIGTPNSTYTFTPGCGTTTITRTTNPPSGVNWYWQTSASGTSTTNNTSTYAVSSTNTYYLRARWGTSGAWSASSQSTGTATVYATPGSPTSPVNGNVISNSASNVNLSVSAGSGATGYKWYSVSSGGTAISGVTGLTYSPTIASGASATYYVASVNGGCELTSRVAVTGNVYPLPVISATNNGELVFGSSVTLSVTNLTYDTYQWIDETGANISGATNSSYVATTVGSYRVKVTKGTPAPPPTQSDPKLVTSQNYITSVDVLEATTSESTANTFVLGERSETTQFFDDIGRPLQTVSRKASPLQKDVIQPSVYDQYNREAKKYLPYTTSTGIEGWIKSSPLTDQLAFYQTGGVVASDASPFSETKFEPSPLARPLEQGSLGTAWQPDGIDSYTSTDHTQKVTYQTNAAADNVIQWVYTAPSGSTPMNVANGGYYSANTLIKTKTKDEDGNETIEFKDKAGRVVLKKIQAPAPDLWASTYYLYDDSGKLVVVLPPEAVVALTN